MELDSLLDEIGQPGSKFEPEASFFDKMLNKHQTRPLRSQSQPQLKQSPQVSQQQQQAQAAVEHKSRAMPSTSSSAQIKLHHFIAADRKRKLAGELPKSIARVRANLCACCRVVHCAVRAARDAAARSPALQVRNLSPRASLTLLARSIATVPKCIARRPRFPASRSSATAIKSACLVSVSPLIYGIS